MPIYRTEGYRGSMAPLARYPIPALGTPGMPARYCLTPPRAAGEPTTALSRRPTELSVSGPSSYRPVRYCPRWYRPFPPVLGPAGACPVS